MPTETGTAAAQVLNGEMRTAALAQDQARIDYASLMLADSGEQADINALVAAAKTLGKHPNEVMADYRQVKEAKAVIVKMQSLAGCKFAKFRIAEYVRQNSILLDAEVNRLERQRELLRDVLGDAHHRTHEFDCAFKRLAELKSSNPMLAPLASPAEATAELTNVAPETQVPTFAAWLAGRVAVAAAPLANSNNPLPAVP